MCSPLISVIIPVYKVPYDCLRLCIESCASQTYDNFEIILVDDGSPDDCGYICDVYGSKDKRIKVIHKINGGVSDARNCGLSNSKGKYVCFVDADDYVSSDYLTTLYELVEKYNCEMSITDFYSHYGRIEKSNTQSKYTEKVYSGVEAVNEMFYQGAFDDSPWGKLYLKDLFSDISYPKGIIFEDTCVTFRLMLKCKKVVFSNKITYYYLLRKDSYEGAPFSDFKLDSVFKTFDIIENDNADSLRYVQRSYKCKMVSLAFHLILKAPYGYSRTDELWHRIRENRISVIWDKDARRKTRIACFLSFCGINCLKWFFNIVDKRNNKNYLKI